MKKFTVLALFLVLSGCSLFDFLGQGRTPVNNGNTSTFDNTAVLGSYSVSENGSASGTASFVITISTGSSSTQILISNFWGVFTGNVIGNMTNSTAFTIARQQPDSDGYYVVGSGTYSNNTLNMTYTVSDERDTNNIVYDNVTSVGTKN